MLSTKTSYEVTDALYLYYHPPPRGLSSCTSADAAPRFCVADWTLGSGVGNISFFACSRLTIYNPTSLLSRGGCGGGGLAS